jgi:uncharacterized protein (DUF1330 family)
VVRVPELVSAGVAFFMANGYWIARVDVTDEDGFQLYARAVGPALAKFGGRFIVQGGMSRVVEGKARSRNVVVEFPSYDTALACWDSQDYQVVKALREGCGIADILIIGGYEGPQPV